MEQINLAGFSIFPEDHCVHPSAKVRTLRSLPSPSFLYLVVVSQD